jgi:hypothetical protein
MLMSFALRSLRAWAGELLSRCRDIDDRFAALLGRGILLPALLLPAKAPAGLTFKAGSASECPSDGGCDGQSSVRSWSHEYLASIVADMTMLLLRFCCRRRPLAADMSAADLLLLAAGMR